MNGLEGDARGVLLAVRAHAGARRNELRGWQNGQLKVAVTQIAEKGKANQAIRTLLAKHLKMAKNDVQLIAGATSSNKKFLLCGASVDEIAKRLPADSGHR